MGIVYKSCACSLGDVTKETQISFQMTGGTFNFERAMLSDRKNVEAPVTTSFGDWWHVRCPKRPGFVSGGGRNASEPPGAPQGPILEPSSTPRAAVHRCLQAVLLLSARGLHSLHRVSDGPRD